VALAGCGAPAAATTTYPATCPISSATPDPALSPTALQAFRPDGAMDAFSRCVSVAPRVLALYTAALALPRTSGIGSCAKGAGVVYELTFFRGSDVVQTMTMMADACLYLYISPTDIRFTGIPFQIQVANVLGLSQLSPSLPLTGNYGVT
jgi:hypothetical protein